MTFYDILSSQVFKWDEGRSQFREAERQHEAIRGEKEARAYHRSLMRWRILAHLPSCKQS